MNVLSTREIVNNIKATLKLYDDEEKIPDYAVAEALNIEPNRLTQSIKRDSPLCREIMQWCHDTGVPMEFIFFGAIEELGDLS